MAEALFKAFHVLGDLEPPYGFAECLDRLPMRIVIDEGNAPGHGLERECRESADQHCGVGEESGGRDPGHPASPELRPLGRVDRDDVGDPRHLTSLDGRIQP